MNANEVGTNVAAYLKREIAKDIKLAARDARALQEAKARQAKQRREEEKAVAKLIGAQAEEIIGDVI